MGRPVQEEKGQAVDACVTATGVQTPVVHSLSPLKQLIQARLSALEP